MINQKYAPQRKWQKKNKDLINARVRKRAQTDKIFRDKKNEATKKWRTNNRVKYLRGKKDNRLRKTYGITLVEFEIMLETQNGVCLICGLPEIKEKDNLSVDHCHSTNKVRGLLCSKCNTAIGLFDEDINRILKAIEYIKEHNVHT